MKTKKIIGLGILSLSLVGCTDWLLEPSPGVTELEDFFSVGETALQSVNAAYAPLAWEYNSTYFNEWFIGDVMSDDALKGGQNKGDMADVYDMENWKVNPNADCDFLLDYYRAQYQGIGRCNLVLGSVPEMEVDSFLLQQSPVMKSTTLQERIIGEAYFLRAYYYFRLVRVFGGVPKVDFNITSSNNWQQPRATVDEIYDLIESDLNEAQKRLWKKSEYADEDLGRATKGAAQAMLLKVNLYRHDYEEARAWGDSVISSQEYQLCPDYADNFTLAGENGPESVFEIQYAADQTSDYGEGFGFTRGTFSCIMTRSRSSQLGGGWGFNHPTQNLYDEFEEGDTRRDVAIFTPSKEQMDTPAEEIYLGSPYLNRKLMWMEKDGSLINVDHATRGPLNNKQIRYADVLLMYAEACMELGDDGTATTYLNMVRQRPSVSLPAYPGYNIKINGEEITPDLRQAIRHERRMELAMEGHRWFDLCRWGIAKETMDAYKATETEEAQKEMGEFIKGKHELLPLPYEECVLNNMQQYPEWQQ